MESVFWRCNPGRKAATSARWGRFLWWTSSWTAVQCCFERLYWSETRGTWTSTWTRGRRTWALCRECSGSFERRFFCSRSRSRREVILKSCRFCGKSTLLSCCSCGREWISPESRCSFSCWSSEWNSWAAFCRAFSKSRFWADWILRRWVPSSRRRGRFF